jgi:hypothetical protein
MHRLFRLNRNTFHYFLDKAHSWMSTSKFDIMPWPRSRVETALGRKRVRHIPPAHFSKSFIRGWYGWSDRLPVRVGRKDHSHLADCFGVIRSETSVVLLLSLRSLMWRSELRIVEINRHLYTSSIGCLWSIARMIHNEKLKYLLTQLSILDTDACDWHLTSGCLSFETESNVVGLMWAERSSFYEWSHAVFVEILSPFRPPISYRCEAQAEGFPFGIILLQVISPVRECHCTSKKLLRAVLVLLERYKHLMKFG